MLKKRNWIPPK